MKTVVVQEKAGIAVWKWASLEIFQCLQYPAMVPVLTESVVMSLFNVLRKSIAPLLLSALFAGTCAGPLIETVGSEIDAEKTQELIFSQRDQDRLISDTSHRFWASAAGFRDLVPRSNPSGFAADLKRNGIGRPLTL